MTRWSRVWKFLNLELTEIIIKLQEENEKQKIKKKIVDRDNLFTLIGRSFNLVVSFPMNAGRIGASQSSSVYDFRIYK